MKIIIPAARIDGQKSDAVKIEGYLLVDPRQSFCMVIPYHHSDGDHPFTFGKASMASHVGFDISLVDIGGAFGRGKQTHAKSEVIWRNHFRPR
jgi:hypothetical protein